MPLPTSDSVNVTALFISLVMVTDIGATPAIERQIDGADFFQNALP